MAWYNESGKENDVFISSRVRFARNVKDYPFDSLLDETSAKEIIEKAESALGKKYKKVDFQKLDAIRSGVYTEKHFVSPEFARKTLPHALFENESNSVEIMVCEEDHFRIQCIKSGLSLEEAFEEAAKAEELLDEKIEFAFSDKLGYLTHCPTNLGTGMRASIMMFLPALTLKGAMDGIQRQLSKLGIMIRGMYGEGSSPDGCMYQISNGVTMGITEEETIQKLRKISMQICESERKARNELKSDNYDRMADRVCRAYGIMKYSRIMSSREFLQLFADVRLGIALGMIENVSYEKLGELLIGVLPANLVAASGKNVLSENERDVRRSEFVRNALD